MLIAEARAKQTQLKDLVTHPGWSLLRELVHGQVTLRRQSIFSSHIQSLEDAFKLASEKSEIAGLQLAIKLPEILLEDLENDLRLLLEIEQERD
jgi:hypothetical protein